MTTALREVLSRIEQLSNEEQDALAEMLRRELNVRDPARRRQEGLAALKRLAELRADLPPVDAVQIARESRDDLSLRESVTHGGSR